MTDETRNIEKVLLKLLDGCDRLSGRIKVSKAGIFVGTHKAAKALLTILLVAGVCAGSYALTHIHKQVTVIINDNPGQRTITYDTTARQIQDFLETEDVDFVPSEDVVLNNQAEFLKNGTTITIEKPIDVYLTADGETLTFSAQPPFTVQDVLDGLGKELGEEDILNFDLTDELKMEDEIVLKRVTYGTATEDAEVAFGYKTINDYDFQIGKVAVTTEGQNGISRKTYKTRLIDGVEESRELISEEVVQAPVDQVTSVGYKLQSGVPAGLSYSRVITCKSVSYWSSYANPIGAYGGRCTYGTCAVDKSVIPLGTRLYIEGYGYAYANDVGSGVKGNMVDLYMESLQQCYFWGARTVRVYILN